MSDSLFWAFSLFFFFFFWLALPNFDVMVLFYLFIYYFVMCCCCHLESCPFLLRDTTGVDFKGRGDKEEQEGVKRGETGISFCYMREKSIFSKGWKVIAVSSWWVFSLVSM